MAVSPEDFVAISDHMGRYCWTVDECDEEAWVALWTEDGVFTGVFPEPLVGREALKAVPRSAKQMANGRLRHIIGNLHCDYRGGRDTVLARYYNLVTDWVEGGRFNCMATCQVTLVRDGPGWLVARNATVLFRG
jgi:hypothetical protein